MNRRGNERRKEKIKAWHLVHAVERKAYQAKYHAEHIDRARERNRNWRKTHPEKAAQSGKKWRESNGGYCRYWDIWQRETFADRYVKNVLGVRGVVPPALLEAKRMQLMVLREVAPIRSTTTDLDVLIAHLWGELREHQRR